MNHPPESAQAQHLVGTVLDDRYKIEALLGEGEMGAVYRAAQRNGPRVAIKVLHEALSEQPELRERFEREARALFGLNHPNILAVHDYGIVEGKPYLVMELLQGRTLDTLVEDQPLALNRALHLGQQILAGLAFAHRQGAIHRDLKTENVIVTHTDRVELAQLLDFGLVKFLDDERWGASGKLTVHGAVFGTPAYMSPEQCAGSPATPASDVYGAGVILFELLTGAWPFMEDSRMKMFAAHLTKPPPTLSSVVGHELPATLEAIVSKALAKRPDQRYVDAGQMLTAIEQLELSPLRHPERTPRRLARVVLIASVCLLIAWIVFKLISS